MSELTLRQHEILEFMEEYREKNGTSPTVQEIAIRFGLKESTVTAHLQALKRKNQPKNNFFSRRLKDAMPSGIWTVPLLGRVCAGNPAECPEYFEGEITIPAGFAGLPDSSGIFALRIQGESMRDAGMLEGDIVIVTPLQSTPSAGDIVVAVIQGGEATVKSFYPIAGGKVELRPANPDFKPQIYNGSEVLLQGKVAALQRNYF